MQKMTKLLGIAILFGLILPSAARAKNAEIMLLPTRVVLEKTDRTSTVVIKNTGDATGDIHIDLVDMKMGEDGMVVPYAGGETPQFSAIPYISMSPRNAVLKPGESQNIRVLVHKPDDLAAGEYRAHLQVRVVDDASAAPEKDVTLSIKTSLVIVIPVILRNGDTTLSVGIEQPRLTRDKDGNPDVTMTLTRDGTRSSMGDVCITCATGSGAPQVIKSFPGVAVYRPTARRLLSVPLDETPKDINLAACKLGVTYAIPQKDGGGKLAEAAVIK